MIKNDFEFNSVANHWNDSNKDDLDVFLISWLVMNHGFIIVMILKPNSSQKRLDVKRWSSSDKSSNETKVLGNEWSQFSSWSPTWSSQLHWNLVPQSVHDHMSRTACLRSLMLLHRDERRQDSVGWFCMMTMHDPIGLGWRPNIWLKIGSNRIKIPHIRQIWVPVTSFYSRNWKISCKEFNLTTTRKYWKQLDLATGCLTKENFQNCFNDCFSRMQKCIDVDEEYFEKINWQWYLNIFCEGWRKNFPNAPCTFPFFFFF